MDRKDMERFGRPDRTEAVGEAMREALKGTKHVALVDASSYHSQARRRRRWGKGTRTWRKTRKWTTRRE